LEDSKVRMLTWVTTNHVTIMIAVSSRVSAFCFSAQSDAVSKCVFDKKPWWNKWKRTKWSVGVKSILDNFTAPTISRKNLHPTDRTRNRHWWTSRIDSGVERTILKELGKFFLYLWKKGSQLWWHKNGGDDFLLKIRTLRNGNMRYRVWRLPGAWSLTCMLFWYIEKA